MNRPEFVFICGAVGSGNTFMFNCLTQDRDVFGVNEDDFGGTLVRLLESERDFGKCPHALPAFIEFLHGLRRDRATLVLKTPSNLRHRQAIRAHLPGSRFVMMIREPHAALVSALRGRSLTADVETLARIWLQDAGPFREPGSDSLVLSYEELVRSPVTALQRVARAISPLSPSVFTYAERMHRPERSGAEHWRSKLDEATARDIERWVETLGLSALYDGIVSGVAKAESTVPASGASVAVRASPVTRARRELFRVWYRLVR